MVLISFSIGVQFMRKGNRYTIKESLWHPQPSANVDYQKIVRKAIYLKNTQALLLVPIILFWFQTSLF